MASREKDDKKLTDSSPPPPPPLPAQRDQKPSTISLKLRYDCPPWESEEGVSKPIPRPPAGQYLFYGTVQDPGILSEVLGLSSPPTLRPAYITGYRLKLWGQYPALVDGATEDVVKGRVFEVLDERAAKRLTDYETGSYRPRPCKIEDGDGEGTETVHGFVFEFCGRESELTDGVFDLDLWLRHMRREPRVP